MHNLVVCPGEPRSCAGRQLSQEPGLSSASGVGAITWHFVHLFLLTGKIIEQLKGVSWNHCLPSTERENEIHRKASTGQAGAVNSSEEPDVCTPSSLFVHPISHSQDVLKWIITQ